MGHPIAIFLTPPNPNYKCAICLDVFDDPVSLLTCGHTFCRSCLDSSLCSQSGRTCPECRADVDDGNDYDENNEHDEYSVIHPVRVLRSAIGDMVVRCKNCLDENGAWRTAITNDGANENANENANDDKIFTTAATVVDEASSDNRTNINTNSSSDENDTVQESQPPPSSSQCHCNWTGPLSQWPIHASQHCPIALLSCPIPGCPQKCSRSEMKSHVGSPACIEAAVATRVQVKMVTALDEFKKQLEEASEKMERISKEKIERSLGRLKREKVKLEEEVQSQKDCVVDLMGANRLLREEVKCWKKKAQKAKDHQKKEQHHHHYRRQTMYESMANNQPCQKKKRKRDAAATSSMDPIDSALYASQYASATGTNNTLSTSSNSFAALLSPSDSPSEYSNENSSTSNVLGEEKKKRKKKNKKRKKNRSRQSYDADNEEELRARVGRSRAVSTDYADVGVAMAGMSGSG